MAALSLEAKSLRASQLAYDIVTSGPVALRPPFDSLDWLSPPQGFAVGDKLIDAALVGETETETILAFRGTLPWPAAEPPDLKVVLDWLDDLDMVLVPAPPLPGLVHQGFLRALEGLWPQVAPRLSRGKPLLVTGHSKGGALANLAAARFVALNPAAPPPVVVTFGAAKPGDAAFQIGYDKGVLQSARYENRDDIVPHLPPGVEFRAMFRNLEAFERALADVVSGYVGVGELRYIDWNGKVVPDSQTLRFERYVSLARLAVTFQGEVIVREHSSGDEGGYAAAVLPPGAAAPVSQPAPGASPVA